MKNLNLNKKRGQITVFVIVAVIIVLSISLIFYVTNKTSPQISPREDPKGYMQKCIKEALIDAELIVIPQGGFASPTFSTKFNNSDVVWMCHTLEKDKLCYNKHPLLKSEIQKEITNLIKPKIETCFSDIKMQLASYGYKEEELNLSTEILLGKTTAKVTKKISFSRNEQTVSISNFDSSISSPLYHFVKLSSEIVNQELSCDCPNKACNADLPQLNKLSPDFEISKSLYGGNEQEIYSVRELLTNKQFNLAIRNCASRTSV